MKLKVLQTRRTLEESELRHLKQKIQQSADSIGVNVDEPLHHDLCSRMDEKNDVVKDNFPEGTFKRPFWDEQLKAAQVSNARQMRWHPMMIRLCLNLKLLSSRAYHSLQTSGFIKLHSERTLRDYTQYFKSKCGFQSEVDAMLLKEASMNGKRMWLFI